MITFDMNICNRCKKIKDCPDRKIFYKYALQAINEMTSNEGGSRSGIMILSCQEPNLLAEETQG